MANIRVEITRTFEMELTEAEAIYLKDLLQNYLGEGEESNRDMRIRRLLFEGLREAL